jgi:hypothetical protein
MPGPVPSPETQKGVVIVIATIHFLRCQFFLCASAAASCSSHCFHIPTPRSPLAPRYRHCILARPLHLPRWERGQAGQLQIQLSLPASSLLELSEPAMMTFTVGFWLWKPKNVGRCDRIGSDDYYHCRFMSLTSGDWTATYYCRF